jgi:GT2 family glycosyltransferase
MDVSVAIVSYNTRAQLEESIAAASADSDELSMEILVVDNASRDGSARMVRERFPFVSLTANPDNRFYSRANNQAIAAARGRHVLILNPDARLRKGTLAAMVRYMDGHPDVGALGIPMRFADGTLQRTCARARTYRQFLLEYTAIGELRPGARERALDRYWYTDWDRGSDRDVDVVPGSCLMVRREAIDRVGGFDERLLLYFSDDDWCVRIKEAGYRVVFAAVGEAVHSEGASARQAPRVARRLYFQDMVRYVAKHFGAARAAWLWLLSRPTRWALDLAGLVRQP